MNGFGGDPNRVLWEERAAGDLDRAWESIGTEPTGIDAEHTDGGLWLRPAGFEVASYPATLLAIHGGGFVSGSVETHRRLFGHLALASRTPVFAVEYGLVPDHVFPSQLDVVMTAYRELSRKSTVAIVGDSSGATLALGIALQLRDEGIPEPAGLMLMSALTDLAASGASYDNGTDPFFTRGVARDLATRYLDGNDPGARYASPVDADPRGLPPTYFQVGGDEALLDDTRVMAQRMRAAGVEVRVDEFAEQLHTFQMAAGRMAAADKAIESAGAWLRSILPR
jgi:acetyl esterase/lipase